MKRRILRKLLLAVTYGIITGQGDGSKHELYSALLPTSVASFAEYLILIKVLFFLIIEYSIIIKHS